MLGVMNRRPQKMDLKMDTSDEDEIGQMSQMEPEGTLAVGEDPNSVNEDNQEGNEPKN